jgi:hypothetical protein
MAFSGRGRICDRAQAVNTARSLDIVEWLTLKLLAISTRASPAARRAEAVVRAKANEIRKLEDANRAKIS